MRRFHPGGKNGVFCGCLLSLLLCGSACAVDGVAITTHYVREGGDNINNLHNWGNLVRHEIEGGRVIRSQAFYSRGDAGFACLSPDGTRVAFAKKNGALAVVEIGGGREVELCNLTGDHANSNPVVAYLQWPAGDGGEWLYYLQGYNTDGSRNLRRCHVKTMKNELVLSFNRRLSSFGLARSATSSSGKLFARVEDREAGVISYDLSELGGNLFNRKEFGPACGVSTSPDGGLFTGNERGHEVARIVDAEFKILKEWRVNAWTGKSDGSTRWQHHRWSVNSMEWIFVTQGQGLRKSDDITCSNAVLYNWSREEQIQVTHNVSGEYDYADDFWDSNARMGEMALGSYAGEAPFTIALEGRLGGKWIYDFGDGAKDIPRGDHTFQRAGVYSLKAHQGARVVEGRVIVHPRKSPRILEAVSMDELHLWLGFDEPVNIAHGKFSLLSGARAQATLAEDGRSAILEVERPLAIEDRFSCQGVVDRAQVPNPLKIESMPISHAPWPANRSQAVFLWAGAWAHNLLFDASTKSARQFQVSPQGLARYDEGGSMSLQGGSFIAIQGSEAVLAAGAGNAITLEMVLRPAVLEQKVNARILGFNRYWGDRENVNFSMDQEGNHVFLSLRTRGKKDADKFGSVRKIRLFDFSSREARHLVVSYVPGELTCYLDGKEILRSTKIQGNLAWEKGGADGLHFGAYRKPDPLTQAPWHGTIDAVAIFARAFTEIEAQNGYLAFGKRTEVHPVLRQVEVRARLQACSKIPELSEIIPYQEAMVVYDWAIEKVLRGALVEKKLRVVHWALLGAEETSWARLKPGDQCDLLLEPWTDHPKLAEYYLSDTLPEDSDPTLYYQVER